MNKAFQNIYQISLSAGLIGKDVWFIHHTQSNNGNVVKKGVIEDIQLRSTTLSYTEVHWFHIRPEQHFRNFYLYRQQMFSSQREAINNINDKKVWVYE